MADKIYRDKEGCNKIQRKLREEDQCRERKLRKDLADTADIVKETATLLHEHVEQHKSSIQLQIAITGIMLSVFGIILGIAFKVGWIGA